MALRTASLCTGYGGLDIGVRLARPDARVVVSVERQAYCAAVLVARMEDEALERFPIWDDLSTFDGVPWRGVVDLVTTGFPCQPVSVAGRRAGMSDERWLWPHVWRIVREMGARLLFVENVPGLISLGLDAVLSDLAACGWAAEWGCFRASDVGAPHRRERLFLLAADPDRDFRQSIEQKCESWGDRAAGARVAADPDGSVVLQGPADPDGRDSRDPADRRPGPGDCGAVEVWPPNPEGQGLPRRDGAARETVAGAAGVPSWWEDRAAPESVFRRVDDGSPSRLDRDWSERIHVLGNGVVPQQAALAWRVLWGRLKGVA